MKVALVHELLTMRGGAERVLRVLSDLYPDAPVYTLLWNPAVTEGWLDARRIRTSTVQPFAKRLQQLHRLTGITPRGYNHHLYLHRFAQSVEAWDFSEFDLVISSSSAFAHGIITNGNPKHLSYIHAPARYLWDRTHDVQSRQGRIGAMLAASLFHRLRVWDSEAADRADSLLAPSSIVQRRIQLYWDRHATVLPPPLADCWTKQPLPRTANHDSPFLVVSTLARYKRIEQAIEACYMAGVPLVIAGEGADRSRLEKLAKGNVRFVGHADESTLRTLYSSARATLFPGDEDFGLVPLEALSQGCPVIAWRGGGALDTLQNGENASLYDDASAEGLAEAIAHFDHKNYSIETCRQTALRYDKSSFTQGILTAQNALMHGS